MPNFMPYMDMEEDEFGPKLSTEEKEDLYSAIMDKHDPKVADARKAAANQSRMANIGSALEGMARAKGVARGGKGVDQSFYKELGKSQDSAVDASISDRKDAIKKYLMDKKTESQGEQREYDRGRDTASDQYRQDKLESTRQNRESRDRNAEEWRNKNYEQRDKQFTATNKRQNEAAALRVKEGIEGKNLTAGATTEIGTLDSADALIEDLRGDYKKGASDYGSGLISMLPGSTDAKNYDQSRKQKAQIIGGILEGGKLTNEDFERYYKMMPSPWDTDHQAENKLNELKQTLALKRKGMVDTLGGAGFNVSGVQPKDEKPKSEPFPGRNDGALSPQDKEAISWAKANPDDPRAAKIFERLGM